ADAARLALRTQQLIASESGVANTVDPVGGSYAIEALTAKIEQGAFEYLQRIDAMGGMLKAIESGWVQKEVQEAAYQYQRAIDTKERVLVGVNAFQSDEEQPIPLHVVDPALEAAQVRAVRETRATRNAGAVAAALERLEHAARG